MENPSPTDCRFPDRDTRRGFTLIELMLVAVILGLLASITAPYFSAARERAVATQMKADMRNMMEGVHTYILLNGGLFPTSLEDMVDGSTYNRTTEVEVCMFVAVPATPGREAYILAMTGHQATSMKLVTAYPLWGNRTLEVDNGTSGC